MEYFPNREECKLFSESEAISYVSKIVDKLVESQLLMENEDVYQLILRISMSYIDYYHKFIESICYEYIRKDICKLLRHFLQNSSPFTYATDKVVKIMYTVLINFSDHSENFAKSILLSGILETITDILFYVDSSNNDNVETKKFLYMSIIIINNVARNPQNNLNYRVYDIKKALEKFLRINNKDELGLISMLTLSYLVEEEEICKLDKGLSVINNLLKHIKNANEKNERSTGFTLKELVHGLRSISHNDNMKIRIDQEGGIPILINILQTNKGDAIEPTLGTLENLCFNDKIRQILKETYLIENVIKPYENSKNEKVKRIYDGILWKIQNKGESFHKVKTSIKSNSKNCFDVFLSYAWGNKDTVAAIHQKLKSYQIRVWIDEEQMEGSSIESMATGIENSKLFILASSNSYRKSENCRHEAEYAFLIKKKIIPIVVELKYKPTSWLGFIIGTKMYYEFSDRRNTEEEIIKLKTTIQSNLKKDVMEEIIEISPCKTECLKPKVVENWTNNDVLIWLEDCQLGHLKHHFTNIDGSLLQIILEIRLSSACYFNESLRNELGMTFFEVVKFHKALKDLSLLE